MKSKSKVKIKVKVKVKAKVMVKFYALLKQERISCRKISYYACRAL
mgnify:CR=1 FL=1